MIRNFLLASLLCILVPPSARAQYQKMEQSNIIELAGAKSLVQLNWVKQLSHRTSLTAGGLFFSDDERVFSTNNYGINLGFSRWLVRIGNAYLSVGAGGLLMQTNAKSVADTKAGDTTAGIEAHSELEYYLSWRFVIFGGARQIHFFNSDYFNRKFLVAGGLKFVL